MLKRTKSQMIFAIIIILQAQLISFTYELLMKFTPQINKKNFSQFQLELIVYQSGYKYLHQQYIYLIKNKN
ncbi:unnamed protein product [Paramecium sonneborni]|uniref:Uncharacterized protein n=1 Tax=Paramecium sonneborni TaxID=65129 RepID=A0A8S1PSN4_9CILI|nr:unnamed protein product [Paramecium sonneborni]